MNRALSLALATACAALFALPAVAAAGTLHIEPKSGGFPLNFTVHGGAGKLVSASATISCTTVTGAGAYANSTSGSVNLTFHGCFGPFGVACTTAGQPSGTVTFPGLKVDNVMVEAATPGVLLTPSSINNVPSAGEGPFASFTCFGISGQVNGRGLIGELQSPVCGATSKAGTLNFGPGADGTQKWKQITTSGTSYNLTPKIGSGEWTTAMKEAHATITFEREGTVNCT